MLIYLPIVIVVLIALWAVSIYNGLVSGRNLVKEAASGIDVQLKRRHDLIPKLVETVKGYMGHESGVLEEVARLRSQAQSAGSFAAKGEAESALSTQLRSVFALAENYPDLKANQNFMDLQKTVAALEDEIQMARRYYNGTVRNFNTRIASFPDVLIARMLDCKEFEYFGASDEDRSDPKISFSK